MPCVRGKAFEEKKRRLPLASSPWQIFRDILVGKIVRLIENMDSDESIQFAQDLNEDRLGSRLRGIDALAQRSHGVAAIRSGVSMPIGDQASGANDHRMPFRFAGTGGEKVECRIEFRRIHLHGSRFGFLPVFPGKHEIPSRCRRRFPASRQRPSGTRRQQPETPPARKLFRISHGKQPARLPNLPRPESRSVRSGPCRSSW